MYGHTVVVEAGSWYRVDTASGSDTPTTVTQPDGVTPVPNVYGLSGSTVHNETPQGQALFTSTTQTLYLKRLTYKGAVAGDTPITSAGADLTSPPAAPTAGDLPGIYGPGGTAGADEAYAQRANVKDKRFAGGAAGDVLAYTNAAITSGQANLTRASGTFPVSLNGKKAIVFGAGAAGADLSTTVTAVASDGSSLTLAANASTTVTGAAAYVGTDSTAAFNAARAANRSIFVPAGTYIYDGAGLPADGTDLSGSGTTPSRVVLGPGKALVQAGGGQESLALERLTTLGGYGAVRLTNTSASVQGAMMVRDCKFVDYTNAAISSTLNDQPYWKIRNNLFDGRTATGTFGVSLNGDNSGSTIEDNQFLLNQFHIKMGLTGGLAAIIAHNDFLRFTAYTGTPRTDIWLAGQAASGNGEGLQVADNKFGSEGIHASDYRILVADEDPASNADVAIRTPNLSTASTMRLSEAKFTGNTLSGSAGAAPPFLTLCAADARWLRIRDLAIRGTPPAYIVNYPFTATPTADNVTNTCLDTIGLALNTGSTELTNKPALWTAGLTAKAPQKPLVTVLAANVSSTSTGSYTDVLTSAAFVPTGSSVLVSMTTTSSMSPVGTQNAFVEAYTGSTHKPLAQLSGDGVVSGINGAGAALFTGLTPGTSYVFKIAVMVSATTWQCRAASFPVNEHMVMIVADAA